jgi:molybdate transport system permease protein
MKAPSPATPPSESALADTAADARRDDERPRERSNAELALCNAGFVGSLALLGGAYGVLIVAMLVADVSYVLGQSWARAHASPDFWSALLLENPIAVALRDPRIRYSIWLSLISCSLAAILSALVAVPLG